MTLPFICVVLSILREEKKYQYVSEQKDIAIIIPSYQNVLLTQPLIDSILEQEYTNFHIYLVADDSLSTEVLSIQPNAKLTICVPEVKLSSKIRSLSFAMDHVLREHDAILILDADNLIHPYFLKIINNYLASGNLVIQGRRIAKNLDSVYACNDATGEIYLNYIQKLAPWILNSSSNIAGSGMAIEMNLFRNYLDSPRISLSKKLIIAEDKILQNYIVGNDIHIAFANEAFVYDEKISKSDQLVRQRSRWLRSYFENVKHSSRLLINGIMELSMNKFLFGLISLSPPMFLLIAASLLVLVSDLFLFPQLAILLSTGGLIFCLNFLWVLYLSKAPKKIWANLYGIPAFIFFQVLALFKMKQAGKNFLATRNSKLVTLKELEIEK